MATNAYENYLRINFFFSKVPAQMFLVDIIMSLIAFFIIIVNKRM